jgi:hypothetical protein
VDLVFALFHLAVMFAALVARLEQSLTGPRSAGHLPVPRANTRRQTVATRARGDLASGAALPLGLTSRSRPMFWCQDGGTIRAGVGHEAPELPFFRLRRAELGGWPGQWAVAIGPGIVACAAELGCLAEPRKRLGRVLPELARLLPPGAPRWIEVSCEAVVLVTCEPLDEGRCAAAAQALEELTEALLGRDDDATGWPPCHAVARGAGPTRCAYCHDALDAEPARCPACATALHPECVAELRRCPTAGCEPGRQAA